MEHAGRQPQELASLAAYRSHLEITADWLLRSIEHGRGGSCAHYSPLRGWSRPYPETTGYLIPTLLALPDRLTERRRELTDAADGIGRWLLDIQNADGSWHGGLHPNPKQAGSVFNTGQILKGMMALYRHGGDERYLAAAERGARWLADGVSAQGLWGQGDYRAKETPSYYTHVTWPMLEVWSQTGEEKIRAAAERFLQRVLGRIRKNGAVEKWGFDDVGSAFTHTIAYTIRGFQESGRLLNDYEQYGKAVEPALDVLIRKTELKNGRLPGEFDEDWTATGSYVCLTGNAQIAICLLLMEQRQPDLRVVNAAAKLVDFVGSVQRNQFGTAGMRGGVAGSYPLWGRYMVMRYPNWAAKYYCDALLRLSARIEREL